MLEKAELLSALRARDVQLSLDGDRLRVSAPKDALTTELQEEIVRRKGELVAHLRETEPEPELPPLDRAPRHQALPASFAQERLWFLQKLEPDSVTYNLQANIPIPGRLDLPALARVLAEIVRRHEVLRTTFAEEEGRLVQVVASPSEVALPVSDLRGRPEAERVREAERLAGEEVRRPFDLDSGPVFRVRLLRLGEGESQLLVTQHHVVSDGWSIALLVEEVLALYGAFSSGRVSPLVEPEFQYGDFAHWQRQWLRGERLQRRLAYWRGKLDGAPPALELPTDRPRPALQTSRGATLEFELSEELARRVHAVSRAFGATPFMTLLAAFQVLLARYSGQEDVVVGSANGSRSLVETERMLGLFVNTLVLRTDISGDPTFRSLVSRVRRTALEAVACGDVPFEKLVEELRPPRDLSRSPLFQVLFVIQNTPLEALVRGAQTAPGVIGERGTAAYDLSVCLIDSGRAIRVTLEYNTDLFDRGRIERLGGHFQRLLDGATSSPEHRISALPMLTAGERQQALVDWNATARPLGSASLPARFAAQAARVPDAVAVSFEGNSLTYRALDGASNRLAHRLRRMGVGPEVVVGIALERSLDMVVALLAVLKAGGAYLPLDPAYPRERLAVMLDDSRARVLITQEDGRGGLSETKAELLLLESEGFSGESPEPPGLTVDPDSLAYLIYTSGSTGHPKGVQVTHRALTNFLDSMAEEPGLGPEDVLLSVTTLSFDIAGLELYLPLVRGARVELVSRETASDGILLKERLAASGATVMQATPATWRLLLEAGWTGGALAVLCGGEALTGDLAESLLRCGVSLWNLYGPTETTIWSALHRVERAEAIAPLGRPIANTQLYVLDGTGEPVAIGLPGELYIGGTGVARGYWNRPDLTAERFVPDSFGEPGSRLYRTGDRVRFRQDGVLEFLGRTDHQVKVRGFRIELGEVEATLLATPAVKAAAVLAREDGPAGRQLVAFVVFGPGDEPTVTELRAALRDRLPGHMVPSHFVFLDAMPSTPNGKMDRNALARLDARMGEGGLDHVEPRTETERLVAEVWKEALGLSRVSVHDNFFDLGGHSLLSMRVLARIEQATSERLGPRELVFQTLEQIAALCDQRTGLALGGSA